MTSLSSVYYPLFLALAAALTWLIPKRYLFFAVVLSCSVYLAIADYLSLFFLIGVTGFTGAVVIFFGDRKTLHIVTILVLVLLFALYQSLGFKDSLLDKGVFIGYAFYTLRAIHFLIESYSDRVILKDWGDFICWMFFLPTLLVGPINRFADFQRDLRRRRWDQENLSGGLKRILYGYVKVVCLAGYFVSSVMAPWVESLPSDSWLFHYTNTLLYGVHLYFVFAGYSDVAIGFALLMGFRVMDNFNHPYIAMDIRDFWKRWHISLSSWCRDYVYTPAVALSRVPLIGAVASMLVLGLWHEFSARYVLWGAWHGIGIFACQHWQGTALREQLNRDWWQYVWKVVSLLLTFNFVVFSFVLTSTDSITEAAERWKVLLFIAN